MNTVYATPTIAAVPSFVGGTTARIAPGASSNVALPAGLREGDIAFVLVGSDNTLDGSTDGILSAGYKKIDVAPADTTPGAHFSCKIMGATPDATVRIKADPNREAVVAIHAWRNVAPENYATSARIASADTGMPNPPSASSTVPSSVHLIAGILDDESMVPSAPSGFGNLVARGGKGAVNTSATVMLASRLLAKPGTVNPGEFGGGRTDAWRAYHLVLSPVGNGSGEELETVAPVSETNVAVETLVPPESIGYGAKVTGGRGGKFVRVTSLSSSASTAGSLPWALQQHPGQPIYIALCVEGRINLSSQLKIDRSNWTIDGRFAPGNGCWITGERLKIAGSNFIIEGLVHLGNGSDDCLSIGDYGGSVDCKGFLVRGCEFKHSGDENVSLWARASGSSTGPKIADGTIQDCIIADSGRFCLLLGDGCENITVARNLLARSDNRYPAVKGFTTRIEVINNLIYNFNQDCVQAVDRAHVDFLGNVFRLGPRWSDIREPILLNAANNFYENGSLLDSKGRRYSYATLFRGGNLPDRTSRFSPTSDLVPAPASSVEALIVANCGPKLHNGSRHPLTQATIDEARVADSPTATATIPGPLRSTTGATYAADNNGIPNAYLAEFPGDTNPEVIISSGLWRDYMVAERIGRWHVTAA